ncbi:hypothetical protein GPALN_002246 [Globodera pallida]|uniref:WAP domain-containing protein n=1 Tax=Globodera pallida TaxID=36090 RepID=A0A183CNR8_GLOPA|nr:hypothetical protein GPALN_002246 [Globodera pallida]
MSKLLLFSCCCAVVCLALMTQHKSDAVPAISKDGGEPRSARFLEGGQVVRVKRQCGEDRCSRSRQCDTCCACVEGYCCPITR